MDSYDDGQYYYRRTMSSVKTPHYWEILAGRYPGPLPEHPYSFREVRGSSPSVVTYNGPRTERNARGHPTFSDVIESGRLRPSTPGTPAPIGFDRRALEDEVSNRLLMKARDTRFDLGTTLGELGETTAFVADALVTVANGVKHLRRGRFEAAARTITGTRKRKGEIFDPVRYAANQQLAFLYGLQPLLSDVHNAVVLLDEGLRKEKTFVVRSSKTKGFRVKVTWPDVPYYGDESWGYVRVAGKLELKVSNPVLYNLQQLGLVNPIAVAWELVPLSFVYDWFVPIGTYLTNIIPPQGVDVVQGSITTKAEGEYLAWTDINDPHPGWHTSLRERERVKYRRVLSSFPAFRFRIPDLSLGTSQVTSGLALLYQSLYK